jgi:predicted permease
MFSVVEGVLLRPLPYERPGELVTVWETFPEWKDNPQLSAGWDEVYLAWPEYQRWRENQKAFSGVAAYGFTTRNLVGSQGVERITVGRASSSLFEVLGIGPILGRSFLPGEDGPDAERVALLGHAAWQERFGSDSGILEATIRLDDDVYTVVGVLPPGFRIRALGRFSHSGEADIWIPIGSDGQTLRAGNHSFDGVARLKPGMTISAAIPETEALLRGDEDPSELGVKLLPRSEEEATGLKGPLYLLLAGAGLLLLIACGNVAILLSGEVTNRKREMAARLALGARPSRLVRQLLTESVLIGLFGSALGVFLAHLGTRSILTMAPGLPRLDEVGVNPLVLSFAGGVGVLTGLLFGLAPSLNLLKSPAQEALRSGSRSGLRGQFRLQQGLISVQIGLTVILLASGGLLTRSLRNLFSVDPGFRVEGMSMLGVNLPRYRIPNPADQASEIEAIGRALEAVPGVTAVSGTSSLPFHGYPNLLSFGIEGRPDPPNGNRHTSSRAVLPGFFETMEIPIVEGRPLSEHDGHGAPAVAVISASLARAFWPGESPLGSRILFGDTLTVVGVAGDVVHESLAATPLPTLYRPFLQEPSSSISFIVRTAMPPEALFGELREAIWSVDREIPVPTVATLADLQIGTTREARFRTFLLMIFAACAAVLAGTGIFGITARVVARRAREMAIRKALGAESKGLTRIALRETVRAGLLGIGGGFVAALVIGRFLTGFLFGVESWDPPTFLSAAGLLFGLSLAASYLPARRAGSVAPMEILREE